MDRQQSLQADIDRLLERPGIRGRDEVVERTDALLFKLEACRYHLAATERLNREVESNPDAVRHASYETESLVIQLRATVEVALQLVNEVCDLYLDPVEVSLHAVVHHPKITLPVLQVLRDYTRIGANEHWPFVFEIRNRVIHHTVIEQEAPLMLYTAMVGPEMQSGFSIATAPGEYKPAVPFLRECVDFAERLAIRLVRAMLR